MPDLPPKYDPTGVSHQSAEETNDPLIADNRNFYKVEKWTKDGAKVNHTRPMIDRLCEDLPRLSF